MKDLTMTAFADSSFRNHHGAHAITGLPNKGAFHDA